MRSNGLASPPVRVPPPVSLWSPQASGGVSCVMARFRSKNIRLAAPQPRTLAEPRPGGGNARAVHFSDEDNGELTRLRRHLAEEKLRAEEAERQLAETQATQRGLMTRAGHADVLVRELKEKLTERETHLLRRARNQNPA